MCLSLNQNVGRIGKSTNVCTDEGRRARAACHNGCIPRSSMHNRARAVYCLFPIELGGEGVAKKEVCVACIGDELFAGDGIRAESEILMPVRNADRGGRHPMLRSKEFNAKACDIVCEAE